MAANTDETFEHIVYQFVNPVTRSVVKLAPPAECMSQAEYDELLGKFADYCQEAWEDKKDPGVLDPRMFRAWGEGEDEGDTTV